MRLYTNYTLETIDKNIYIFGIAMDKEVKKEVIDEANIEDLQKENKILKSKVKTYEQDISNRPEVVYSKSVNFLKKNIKR